MTRVPTTATYHLYMSQMTKQKTAMTDVSYQATSGNKYASYDKYGLTTYRLLSLQNERAVTTKYLETNSITQIKLETQEKSVNEIRSTLIDIRSKLRDFYSADLTAMSKDPTEENLLSLHNIQEGAFEAMSLIAYYLNAEIDGNYVFGGGETNVPPVDFSYMTLEEFQNTYDGDILTYSTTPSASLSRMSTSADTLKGVTMEQEFDTFEPKTILFNASTANTMTFDYTASTLRADAGTFTGLTNGDQVVVSGTGSNDLILTVNSVSGDGSTITFDEDINDEVLGDSSGVVLKNMTPAYTGAIGNVMTFDHNDKTLTADAGTFSGLANGTKVVISGTGSNNRLLTVDTVSGDGSKITFVEDVADETLADSDTVALNIAYTGSDSNVMTFTNTVSKLTANAGTFAGLTAGSQVIVDGSSAGNDGPLTVLSVSDDGSTVTFAEPVTDEPSSSDLQLTSGSWTFASVYDPTTGITTNSLTARAGSFSDLKEGHRILVSGTASNDGYLTVQSISDDGSTIIFEETVTDESLDTSALTSGTVDIKQSTQTGKITANSNIGEVIETYDINRNLMVDAVNNTLTGISGTFLDLSGGQTITITDTMDNEHTLYVKSVSEDGSTLSFSSSTPVPATSVISAKTLTTHTDTGGFITSSMKGSALQTGNVSFNPNQNTMTATVKGAFSQYSTGDCLIIKGADSNDKMYIVESVSADGRTVRFSKDTPIVTEMNDHSGTPVINGKGLTICKTYPVGSTVEMTGTDQARNGLYTVLGVSDDGKELTVRTEIFSEYGLTETFSDAAFQTTSYYQGGHLSSGYRISETSNIADDINAAATAFEKIFRALGNIAQGNLLDPDDPENTEKRVLETLDLLDQALTVNPNKGNSDVTSIQYAVISRMDQVKTTIEDQTELQNSMETYISALTQVDKTEAVTMLLQASENLKVSYSVLSAMNSLSLLNYL